MPDLVGHDPVRRSFARLFLSLRTRAKVTQDRAAKELELGRATILRLEAAEDGVKLPARVGVCFDTCHAFAAGYPLATPEDFRATWKQFDAAVGLARLKAIHLNDSKRELGSRVDRHEHIGRGKLGSEPFRLLLADKRFRKIPMYLETEKGEHEGEKWDVINLRVLRELAERG